MTPPRAPRRALARLLLPLLLAAAGVVAERAPVAAQWEELLNQRQFEYDAAKAERDARKRAWDAQQDAHNRALQTINELKAQGVGGDRLAAADRQATLAGIELARHSRRVEEAEQELEVRRRALEEALDVGMGSLDAQLARAATNAERTSLAVRISELERQYGQLGQERGTRAPLTFFASVTIDPRDRPEVRTAKAQLVDMHIEYTLAEIERVDAQIASLQNRLNASRRAADAMAGINRFDGPTLPTGVAGRTTTDAGQAAASEPPFEQQIEELRLYRTTVLEVRLDQLRVRVIALRPEGGR